MITHTLLNGHWLLYQWKQHPILWSLLGAINLYTLALYLYDKKQAMRHQYRVPERTLLLWACCGGALGAMLGMYTGRHKTRKPLFMLLVPLSLAAQIGLLGWLFGIRF